MLLALATQERPWADIPGVWVIGLIAGGVIIIAAIRYMFRGR